MQTISKHGHQNVERPHDRKSNKRVFLKLCKMKTMCFLSNLKMTPPLDSHNAVCDTTTWRGLALAPLATWKESLSKNTSATMATQKNCYLLAKIGQNQKVAPSLQVIVKLQILIAWLSIYHLALKKQIESFVLQRNYNTQLC